MYKISFKYACLWSSLNVAYVTIIDRQDSAEMTEEMPMISCPFVIPKLSISIYVSSDSYPKNHYFLPYFESGNYIPRARN